MFQLNSSSDRQVSIINVVTIFLMPMTAVIKMIVIFIALYQISHKIHICGNPQLLEINPCPSQGDLPQLSH